MLGNPDFKRDDMVRFHWETEEGTVKKKGVVYVVDALGTADQTQEASYDIMVSEDGEKNLYKHIPESLVEKISPDEWLNS